MSRMHIFSLSISLSLVNLENQFINVKAQMIVAHLCTKEVKEKKRGSVVCKVQLLASLYHPVFTIGALSKMGRKQTVEHKVNLANVKTETFTV